MTDIENLANALEGEANGMPVIIQGLIFVLILYFVIGGLAIIAVDAIKYTGSYIIRLIKCNRESKEEEDQEAQLEE